MSTTLCHSGPKVGTRDPHEAGQTISLRRADAPAQAGEPVVPATLIILRNGAVRQLLSESLLDESLQRPVQGRGSHANDAVRGALDSLHDGVAVALAIGERHEHVELRLGQREEGQRIGVSHAGSSIISRCSVRHRVRLIGPVAKRSVSTVQVGHLPAWSTLKWMLMDAQVGGQRWPAAIPTQSPRPRLRRRRGRPASAHHRVLALHGHLVRVEIGALNPHASPPFVTR